MKEAIKPRVGIPRALLYYTYYPLWHAFLTELGVEVVVSPPTTKGIVDAGVKVTVDEACLPVKVFCGHVASLRGSVDYIFVPRLVSVEHRAYICPKFMGLPDIVRNNISRLPELIAPSFDCSRGEKGYISGFYEVGRVFTHRSREIRRAYNLANERLSKFVRAMESGLSLGEAFSSVGLVEALAASQAATSGNANVRPGMGRKDAHAGGQAPSLDGNPSCRDGAISGIGPGEAEPITIGIIGHPYNIYDSYVNMRLIERLEGMGARIITPEMLPLSVVEDEAARLPKRLFWTFARRILGAAYHFLSSPKVHGCLHITAFGCGPDSLVGELIEREAKRRREVPFMTITIDEHTGEAGVVTRLEAFMDMIRRGRGR